MDLLYAQSIKRGAFLAVAVMAWLHTPIYASEATPSLNQQVIVTADAAKELAKIESQSVSIITKEDIAKKQAKSVEDIIFDETGVTRTVDAMGRVGISIRGSEPRHTLILIDGVPVLGDFAKYAGQGDELQRIGAENVERIEILKGAASAKYGTDAVGGIVNIITKIPSANAKMQFNVEGRRIASDSHVLPYKNFFLRADSGTIGKLTATVYGGKRDIMPVYSEEVFTGGINTEGAIKNSLRYFGDIKNMGFLASYDANEQHHVDVAVDKAKEDMDRFVKHSNDSPAPVVHYKRHIDRNTYRLQYIGENGTDTDWNVNFDYTDMNEDDITLSSVAAFSKYEGKNTLAYLDSISHTQWNLKAQANRQINDAHVVSYGVGISKEHGEGSRLKSALKRWTTHIDPWDYDKNLHTEKGSEAPSSKIYDFAMYLDENDIPQYDNDYEMYGYKDENGKTVLPAYTYADYEEDEEGDNLTAFADELRKENPMLNEPIYWDDIPEEDTIVRWYYTKPSVQYKGEDFKVKWHGKAFGEEKQDRRNRQVLGSADITKANFFVQDVWQANDDTIIVPIVRVDHSSLFGSNLSFNMGLTHEIGGRANERFKANIGTGYTEPGMGELYYHWEMYAGMPYDFGVGKLGYYWFGNPHLKPEKSFNIDLGYEKEFGKSTARINVFHNRIKNYMTPYFVGKLMNFHPNAGVNTWITPPDMIYSFKNIGNAEIIGVETEFTHQFNDQWSARLGYTYLHAINKSDPTMPRQLLNKPQHKFDLGITYQNKKSGWRASLWSNYYFNMLDSNTIANNGNFVHNDIGDGTVPVYFFAEAGKQTYEKKSFGLWNILVQKQFNKDTSMYIGIDNLFNHRDDDQAIQERVYRVGLNLQFGGIGDVQKSLQGEHSVEEIINGTWFISSPFDSTMKEGIVVNGEYQSRWNSFTGKVKPQEARVTTISHVGSAYKNYLEAANHTWEHQIRIGAIARIGENTSVTVLGAANGFGAERTAQDVAPYKGIHKLHVDTLDVSRHAGEWDYSIGRLEEPMGVTGYWFNHSYDGVRAIYTEDKNQVRIGAGNFSHSTGITDSAYTHATKEIFMRAPTKYEWLGHEASTEAHTTEYSNQTIHTEGFESLYDKLLKVNTLEEEKKLIDSYLEVVKKDDPKAYEEINVQSAQYSLNSFVWRKVTLTSEDGSVKKEFLTTDVPLVFVDKEAYFDTENLKKRGENAWELTADVDLQENRSVFIQNTRLVHKGKYVMTSEFYNYGAYEGKELVQDLGVDRKGIRYIGIPLEKVKPEDFKTLTQDEAKEKASTSLWSRDTGWEIMKTQMGSGEAYAYQKATISPVAKRILSRLASSIWKPENDSTLPLHLLEKEGFALPQLGTVLIQDQIPSIEGAAFVQVKRQVNDSLGLQAWYFRSWNDKKQVVNYAIGDTNGVASFDHLANVIGIGGAWKLSNTMKVSFDWGKNLTNYGKFMNGSTLYEHTAGTSKFAITGREYGHYPSFWVVRFDVGHSDMNKPKSWNAYVDYKAFEHGSFFGGNGTESLPDRYLDGIRSFTVGGGYVPMKNLLLEVFYTFGAEGINKRDTLYGDEHFGLGDYTRVQATYRF